MMATYQKQTVSKTTEIMSQQQATTNMQSETHEKIIYGTWAPHDDRIMLAEPESMTAEKLDQYTIVFNAYADYKFHPNREGRRLAVFKEICGAEN
jgi:hypothetical protein